MRIATIFLALLSLCPTAVTRAAWFQGVGDLPGGQTVSGLEAVSADGAVAIGFSRSSEGGRAVRWTRDEGLVQLGPPANGGFASEAFDVSADGTVITGDATDPTPGVSESPFRWTEEGGTVLLDNLPSATTQDTRVRGISADGSTIVGQGRVSNGFSVASRWTRETGNVSLGSLPGDIGSAARAVSADGSVVVGRSRSLSDNQAFRWTSATGMVGLGSLEGASDSDARALTPDASVIVGDSGGRAFRWTSETGLVDIGGGVAHSVSADGGVIVGELNARATLWDAANGMRDLRGVLANDYGLAAALDGWTLFRARDVSADGTVFVGWGLNPQGDVEGWIASTVPEPSTASLALSLLLAGWKRRPVALRSRKES